MAGIFGCKSKKLAVDGSRRHLMAKAFWSAVFPIFFFIVVLFTSLASYSAAATLNVTLQNGLSGELLAGIKITAAERLSTGKLKWTTSQTTDGQGRAAFTLDGLGWGKVYVLYARVYNGISSYSDEIASPGNYVFKVGKLEVTVVSGIDGSPLANLKVAAKERQADGTLKWLTSGKTDERGVIRFDLKPLQEGKTCVLRAKSPVDGSSKYSGDITANGRFLFTVGNQPLIVTLQNGLSGGLLAGVKVTAAERLSTGKLKWTASRTTDSQGRAVFDLDGLGQGRIYAVYCRPYNGGTVYSPDFSKPLEFIFRVGTLPVTLIDSDLHLPLVGKKIVICEKTPEGKLHWLKSGVTDGNGQVVFDLPGLHEGRVYVAKAYDPYANGKKYYSPWITAEGEFVFSVSRTAESHLDLTPPWVNIDNPKSESEVTSIGFTLSGRAADNQEIDHVEVIVADPLLGQHLIPADYDPGSGHWKLQVPAAMISADQTLLLTARAIDRSYNISATSISLSVIVDDQAPKLEITSPANNAAVFNSGFMVSGYAVDNTGITGLRAVLIDPVLGSRVIAENLPVAASTGRWTLVVGKDQVSVGNSVQVLFTAKDGPGNEASAQLSLAVTESQLNAGQLLNRITFGATPALLTEISRIGPEAFLERQMHPETIDDSYFEHLIGNWVPQHRRELTAYQLVYAAYSSRQLQEVMTWFWENHFNTDVSKHGHVEYELRENRLFREHALGKFKDLLTISATSPAMLYYLDNVSNRRQAPNENYAREIMELHTMGVDGGYTQADIVEVARAFTGWRVHDGEFDFSDYRHDYGEKMVLGETLPAGQGVEDGYQVIDILARHPSTARFISRKLLQFLVDDEPSPELVDQVAEVFLGSDGDIATVVSLILHLPEFNQDSAFHSKVKTPLEFVTGLIRNLPVMPIERHLRRAMDGMGMRLFHYPLPTGWPETGDKWVNSNQLLQRLLFANAVAFNDRTDSNRVSYVDLKNFFKSYGFETAPGIVGFLFKLALGNDYSQLEWDMAVGILTDNQTVDFDINQADAEQRLREMTGTVLSFPSYQLQ